MLLFLKSFAKNGKIGVKSISNVSFQKIYDMALCIQIKG